ncbi:MAG: hypothetical protein JSU70_12065 [Phycisphaerales bacterium]|nr:MAG: hypothetical protein JSU70_12065 [Phycisphaerales bacterium]
MAKNIVQRKLKVILLVVAGSVAYNILANAGSLEPSSGPGSTMKTLDEVEPRIPIPGSNTPVGPFYISRAGSYYLTGNRTASTTGIYITQAVGNVTIDLSGFTLTGSDSGTSPGIRIGVLSGISNVEIRNGTIRGFEHGIYENDDTGTGHRVINVRAISNTKSGIYLPGSGHLVKDCTVSDSGTQASDTVNGIYVGSGCTVTGNTVRNNGLRAVDSVYCIRADDGCTVTGNTVSFNGESAGVHVHGIYVRGSTVTGNTVYGNGKWASSIECIDAWAGSMVTGNTVSYNGIDAARSVVGISSRNSGTVTDNTVFGNGHNAGSTVYGIFASHGNTVTGNAISRNGESAGGSVRGLYVDGSTVIGNTVWYNGQNSSPTSDTFISCGIYLGGYCFVDQNNAQENEGTNMNSPGNCTFGRNHAP